MWPDKLQDVIDLCDHDKWTMIGEFASDESVKWFPCYYRFTENDELAAVALLTREFDGAIHINRLYVPEEHRRKGYARMLIRDIIAHGKSLSVHVHCRNVAALSFFRSCNFVQESEEGGYHHMVH